MMYMEGRCYKIMTKFISLKHSIVSCNAIINRVNFKLNQLKVAKSKKVKLLFYWTFTLYQTKVRRSGRLYRATVLALYCAVVLALYQTKVRRSGRLFHFTTRKRRPATHATHRAAHAQGLYRGVQAGSCKLEAGTASCKLGAAQTQLEIKSI